MPQQVTGRVGHEGVGRGPHRPGPLPGWHVVPPPRAPYAASRPVDTPPSWASAPFAPVAAVGPMAPAPAAAPSGAPRSLVVVAVTVVVLAVLTLVGVLLYPRIAASGTVTAATAAPAPTTVVVPSPVTSGSSGSSSGYAGSSGAYSCGSANGYAIEVQNGNVPCTSARWVTTMWTTDGTTPMSGAGPAGTPYSWTCSSVTTSGDEVASCVSKMGSTFTISR